MDNKISSKSVQGTQSKTFMGVLVTSELKMYLNNSHEWKDFLITQNPKTLTIIQHDNKEYLGHTLETSTTIEQLTNLKHELKGRLQQFCPQYNSDKLKTCIFAQQYLT